MLVVLDTDALLAIADVNDALHTRATGLAKKLSTLNANVLLSPTTLAEFAMVATHHIGFQQTKKAVDTLYTTYSLFNLDTVINHSAIEKYGQQTSKHNTLFDCYVMSICGGTQSDCIFSFDKGYTKNGFDLLEDYLKAHP